MSRAMSALAVMSVLALWIGGCAVATVSKRQADGTYRTTRQLVWWSPGSFRSFTCQEDYMVATTMSGVTYAWPKGKGYWKSVETTTFEGDGLRCEAHNRTLTVNGRVYGEFEEGDEVFITPDGRVLIDGVEQPAAEGG